jgi:hypothetical protein
MAEMECMKDDYYCIGRIKSAQLELRRIITEAIKRDYSEHTWPELSLKTRKEIITELFYESNIPDAFSLSKEEKEEVLRNELKREL